MQEQEYFPARIDEMMRKLRPQERGVFNRTNTVPGFGGRSTMMTFAKRFRVKPSFLPFLRFAEKGQERTGTIGEFPLHFLVKVNPTGSR